MLDALGYRSQYNPQFLARIRERQARERMAKLEAERLRLHEQERERRKTEAEKREAAAVARMRVQSEGRFCDMVKMLNGRNAISGGTSLLVADIMAFVAAKHGVTIADIKGQCRTRLVVAARFEAIAEVKRLRPDLSLLQMARLFHRDHTSILHALRKMGVPTAQPAAKQQSD